jgi:hypothetical protein
MAEDCNVDEAEKYADLRDRSPLLLEELNVGAEVPSP